MQIFRPFKSHSKSAMFLDDVRLNKQVVEGYQIMKSCLAQMRLIEDKPKWVNHPITKMIYNNGFPYLPDLYLYIDYCNKEWIKRGKNRSIEFQEKLDNISKIIEHNKDKFSWNDMPELFVGNKIYSRDNIYEKYQNLLYDKWSNDKIKIKCSLERMNNSD